MHHPSDDDEALAIEALAEIMSTRKRPAGTDTLHEDPLYEDNESSQEYDPYQDATYVHITRPAVLPTWQRDILTEWVSAHATAPYPDVQQHNMLVTRTGLTGVQVNNWMSNYRRRKLKGQRYYRPPKSMKVHKPSVAKRTTRNI